MFERSDGELTLCLELNEILIGTSVGPDFERVLVGHALSTIHAEFERAINDAIRDRCHIDSDQPLNSFVRSAISRKVRTIKVSELCRILEDFDPSYKERFQQNYSDSIVGDAQLAVTYYDNLESNRQLVAHKLGSQATLIDVAAWFREAKRVIVWFREALDPE